MSAAPLTQETFQMSVPPLTHDMPDTRDLPNVSPAPVTHDTSDTRDLPHVSPAPWPTTRLTQETSQMSAPPLTQETLQMSAPPPDTRHA